MNARAAAVKNAGSLKITAAGEREIVMTRVFDAPRKLVFDAHTEPELLKRWLFRPNGWSLAVCDIDLRVGGAFRYVWRKVDGTEMGMSGTYREIVRPERIVHTEVFDDPWFPGTAIITTVLLERDARTTFTCTMLYESREARDGVLKSPMESGLDAGYSRLDDLLASTLARRG